MAQQDKTAQQDWLCIPTLLSDDSFPAHSLGLVCTLFSGVSGWLDPHGGQSIPPAHGEMRQAVPETGEGKGCLRERCVWIYIAEGGQLTRGS